MIGLTKNTVFSKEKLKFLFSRPLKTPELTVNLGSFLFRQIYV